MLYAYTTAKGLTFHHIRSLTSKKQEDIILIGSNDKISFSYKKKWNCTIFSNIDSTAGHHIEW